jgi:predicted PolB exonuclease-like 3'-5' exonuclease
MRVSHAITNILFLDIETIATQNPNGDLLDAFKKSHPMPQKEFETEYREAVKEMQDPDAKFPPIIKEKAQEVLFQYYQQNAGLYSEFGQIVSIATGYVTADRYIVTKDITGIDEKEILSKFFEVMNKAISGSMKATAMGGHNIKEFDIPYICQRAMINGMMEIPMWFELDGKKPWEMNFIIDTFDMWKSGKFRGTGTLQALAAAFGLPNPKMDGDGANVWEMFAAGEIGKIGKYCMGDVITDILLFEKMTTGKSNLLY